MEVVAMVVADTAAVDMVAEDTAAVAMAEV